MYFVLAYKPNRIVYSEGSMTRVDGGAKATVYTPNEGEAARFWASHLAENRFRPYDEAAPLWEFIIIIDDVLCLNGQESIGPYYDLPVSLPYEKWAQLQSAAEMALEDITRGSVTER